MGKPINAEAAVAYHTAELSLMIQREDGKYILCKAAGYGGGYWWRGNILEGKTVIQSEIDDNDDEPILLRGRYNGNIFEFGSLSANGYTIKAERM